MFSHLRPPKTKRAREVALEYFFIFLEFGTPYNLQRYTDRKFTASIITELTALKPDCEVVHGKPRNPKSQGSVERAIKILKMCYVL